MNRYDAGTTRWRSIHQDTYPRNNTVSKWDEIQSIVFIVASWLEKAPWILLSSSSGMSSEKRASMTLELKKQMFTGFSNLLPNDLIDAMALFAPMKRLSADNDNDDSMLQLINDVEAKLNGRLPNSQIGILVVSSFFDSHLIHHGSSISRSTATSSKWTAFRFF